MNLNARDVGNLRIVDVLDARIDAAVAIAFKDKMRELSDEVEGDVVLNLKNVAFVDSSGLGAIVAAMKHLGSGRRLHLAALGPMVTKVFKLTRMDKVFVIHENIEKVLISDADL